MPRASSVDVSPEVFSALSAARPVVALESSVIAQGLPKPANREAVARMTSAIRSAGAVPAITAVVRGAPTVGMSDADLERFLGRDRILKLSARDLPWAVAQRRDGATTVAAAIVLAALAGVTVFATGGIGGVHRQPPFDESADLVELTRTPVVVVCSGAKSILDLAATAERLETLGVPLVGYRTDQWPAFYVRSSGLPLAQRADDPAQIVTQWSAQRALGLGRALLVLNPVPESDAIPAAEMDSLVADAGARARRSDVTGAALTPYLLSEIAQATNGRSVKTNLALLEANARLAAEIAVRLSNEG